MGFWGYVNNIRATPAAGAGTTAQRDVWAITGMLWVNLDDPADPYLERYDGAAWIPFTASSPTLPAWALAGNDLAGGEKLGSTNGFPVNMYVNNAKLIELFTTGRVGINAGGTDPGELLYINGTTRTTNSIKIVENSVTSVIGPNTTNGNYKPLKFVSPGAIGGWNGGFTFAGGNNGTVETSQTFSIGRYGGIGIGNLTPDSVNVRPTCYVKVNNTPTTKFSTGFFIASPQIYSQYSKANGFIVPVLVMGGSASLNNPTASVMQIGWQWSPVAAGNASAMIISGMDETTNVIDIVSVWTGNGGCLAVGTTTHDTSAKMQVDSTTKGFLPPRMTTTQRDAIASPAAGLMIFNTTTAKHQGYDGTTWNDFY